MIARLRKSHEHCDRDDADDGGLRRIAKSGLKGIGSGSLFFYLFWGHGALRRAQ